MSTPSDDGIWFRQRRYGYGAGLPVRWQGWALFAGFLAVLLGATLLPLVPQLGVEVAAVAVLVIVTRRHTEGGWRWRFGKD